MIIVVMNINCGIFLKFTLYFENILDKLVEIDIYSSVLIINIYTL